MVSQGKTERNWTRILLICSGSILFGVIFSIACIITLARIFDSGSTGSGVIYEPHNYDVDFRSSWYENEYAHQKGVLSTRRKVVCYLTIPGNNVKHSTDYLDPSKVDPQLCTHLVVGFASVVNCSLDLGDNTQIYKDASDLKRSNPDLKVMISVAGMNEISSGFPEMTRNHANRKIFIRSVLAATKSLRLDGLDVDWEFPAWLDTDGRQKIHFVQLLQELKKAFNRSGQKLVLSAAVAATEAMIDQCYNVPEIAEHVDFVNLMAYDYHFYTRLLPFTGFNAPLFSNPNETGLWSTLNVNYSTNHWMEKGMPKEKIIVGIPTYGHSFTLTNKDNHGLQAPCTGYGSLGSDGFVSYPIVCNFLKNGAVRVSQNNSKVPYAFLDKEWISYDDTSSVTNKANWIRSAGFGGGMIFSLNTDDFSATCDGNSSFPLTRIIKNIFDNDSEDD